MSPVPRLYGLSWLAEGGGREMVSMGQERATGYFTKEILKQPVPFNSSGAAFIRPAQ